MSFLDDVKFDDKGLVPAIAQDATSGKILMMAWMNREALQATVDKQEAVYFSRSRQALWHKGETSGHTQLIKEIRLDCDADAIVLKVEQIGGIACHTGRESCFYKQHINDEWVTVDEVIKHPKEIYA